MSEKTKILIRYYLLWLVIPFAVLTLIKVFAPNFGISESFASGLDLLGKLLIFGHILLRPTPRSYDPLEYHSFGISDIFPGAATMFGRGTANSEVVAEAESKESN